MLSPLAVCLALAFASPVHADPPESALLHFTQGLLLEGQGNYSGAMKEYQETTDLDPDAGYVYRREAELSLDLGDLDNALKQATRALALEGPTAPGYRVLGNAQWARGDIDAAKDAFEKALGVDPSFEDALLALASLNASTDPALAKDYYRKVAALDPSNAGEAYYQIALLDEHQGDVDAAKAGLLQALDADPDHVQARYALAQIYEVRQDTEAALDQYQELLLREPKDPALWVRVGEIQGLMGDMAAAEASFARAQRIQPDNPAACYWLAQFAEQRGDFASAAADLKGSSQLASDPKLALRLSYDLAQAGQPAQGVAVLEAAFKKWSGDSDLGYYLALGYDDENRTPDALAVIQRVVALVPDSRDARFELAALYEKVGRMADSEREFEVILSSHPDDAAALNYLGYSLADRDLELPRAKELIREAVALDPTNGAYLDSLAWVDFRLGLSTQAAAEIKTALRSLPADDSVWEHAGDIYRALGDATVAWEAWKFAQGLNPANPDLAPRLKAVSAGQSDALRGAELLEFLGSSEGSVASLLGDATVTGKVAGKNFSFSGLLHFQRSTGTVSAPVSAASDAGVYVSSEAALAQAPGEVRIEMLGPMFLPVWRAYLGPNGEFLMDPLDIRGLSDQNVSAVVEYALRFLRDYWSGALFAGPGRYHKGWSRDSVHTARDELYLSSNELYLQSVEPRDGGPRVALADFQKVGADPLARVIELSGRGYEVRVRLDGAAARFYGVSPELP